MPLNPGNDRVTFHSPQVPADRLHRVTGVASTPTPITGCALQSLRVTDNISNTEFAEATDRCIAPANATTKACAPGWKLEFTPSGAATQWFRVIGVKPFRDKWGRTDHITIYAAAETGSHG